MYHSLMLLAGMLALFHGISLPNCVFILILATLSLSVYRKRHPFYCLFATFGVGYCWAFGFAVLEQQHDLPPGWVNRPVVISGCVVQINKHSQNYQRLTLDIENTYSGEKTLPLIGKVSLAHYKRLTLPVEPGWCGQFKARLKPVHGRLNPRGFDYESWAYVNKVKANGSLLKIIDAYPGEGVINSYRIFKSRLTAQWVSRLQDNDASALLISLALGDRELLNQQHWQVLRHSGTSHLLAISGLHIGLVFWMASTLGAFIWRLGGPLAIQLPAQKAGWLFGIILSAGYLVLTGFPLSGRRAWVMLASCVYVWVFSKNTNFRQALAVALFVVLLFWPSSVLSLSFWFSFIAVALILCFSLHYSVNLRANSDLTRHPKFEKIVAIVKIQCLLSIALIPLNIVNFGEFSLISPVANLIAVPVVSMLILPLILLGLVLYLSGFDWLSVQVLDLAQTGLNGLFSMLEALTQLNAFSSIPAVDHPYSWYLMLLAIFAYYFFRNWPGRWLLLLTMLPVIFSPTDKLKPAQFELVIFDVGQGSAAWIKTAKHNVIIDTGFGIKAGFNYFDSVIYPQLRASSVRTLEAVIISHGDADHSGGFKALLDSDLIVHTSYTSEASTSGQHQYCAYGLNWRWDDVHFEFLTQQNVKGDNNRSCILKVSSPHGCVLLPGDIERQAELKLVKSTLEKLNCNILIVPHHGSLSSSTATFIDAVMPEKAVFSSGYLNRYGHPVNKVVNRYQDRKIELFNTACDGQIRFNISDQGISKATMRTSNQPFWRHQCS